MSILIGQKPIQSLSNRIEIMNEFLMCSICYSSIVVTDYLRSSIDKYKGAWVTIALITLTLTINISIVIWFIIGNFKLLKIKYMKRLTRCVESKMPKKEGLV